MAIRLIPVTLLFLGALMMHCKSNLAQTKKSYDSLLNAKFGTNYTEKVNPSKTYSLIHSQESATAVDFPYAVIKLKDNEVVLEGKYNRGGYAKWLTDTTIEVLTIPRHVTKVPDTTMYKRQIFIEPLR